MTTYQPRDVPPTTPNAPATGWSITGQQRTIALGPSGVAEQGIEVQFLTGKGVSGHIFVPMSRYNPQNVRAAVAAQAAVMDEIQGMSG